VRARRTAPHYSKPLRRRAAPAPRLCLIQAAERPQRAQCTRAGAWGACKSGWPIGRPIDWADWPDFRVLRGPAADWPTDRLGRL